MMNKYLILVMMMFAVPGHVMTSAPAVESTAVPLDNLGNTCFLNALMQCFFSVPSIKKSLRVAYKTNPQDLFVSSLCTLQNRLDRRFSYSLHPIHRVIPMRALLKEFHTLAIQTMFPGDSAALTRQQDPSELAGLITEMINDVARFPFGEIGVTTICDGHAYKRIAPTAMFNLNLAQSIQKAIYNAEEPETLSGANQYDCDACGRKVDATKVTEFKPAPELFIARLMRECVLWDYDPATDAIKCTTEKNKNPIIVEEAVTVDGKAYVLTGMILHQGEGVSSGHYIALVRDIKRPEQWFLCNDESITDGNEAIEAYYAGRTYSFPVMESVGMTVSKEDDEDKEFAALMARVKTASLASNPFDVTMLFYQGDASGSVAAASGAGGE